jgi:hypothetical protein
MKTLPRPTGDRPLPRRLQLALSSFVTVLLVSGVGAAYLRQRPTVVTVDDAVAAFRASSPSSTSTSIAEASVSVPVDDTRSRGVGQTAPAPAATHTAAVGAPSSTQTPPTSALARTSAAAASAPAPANPGTTSSAPPTDKRAEIEEGVYPFATEGFEATNALGGARHDYPRETPVTLRRADCGWTQRWQPLSDRWDESLNCPVDDGLDVRRFTTYHEFFQRSQQQQFDCPPGSFVFRRSAPNGSTWSWHCTANGSAIDTVVTVVGTEPVGVGGQEVPATRVHYDSTMTGANRGTQVQDRWIRPDDGLNLRIKTDIDTEADSPFGAVHYEEHYTITMLSLHPRR